MSAPLPFPQACWRHSMLGRIVTDANNATRELATEVYAGVTGVGYRSGGSFVADAIADTTPPEFAALVMTDDIAGAAAAAVHLQAFYGEDPSTARDARKLAHEGWAAFRALADRAATMARGTGADSSEAWPIFERVEELRPDPERMRAIADLAGRMLGALRGAPERRAAALPDEIVGVERGAEVTGLLPTEYALMGLPETEAEAYRRLAERQAEQYERRGKERKHKGPLVICVDESASMIKDPKRNTWAKAAATALTRLAWEDKRPVVWVHFSSATRSVVLRPGNHVGLVEAQATFLDGGTNIASALIVGADEVTRLAREGYAGADVVLVSDGTADDSYYLPSALDAIKAVGARLWAIAIAVDWHGTPSEILAKHASKYIHLTSADMRSPGGVVKVAGAVAK